MLTIGLGIFQWLRHGQPTKGPVLAPPILGGSELQMANSLFVVLATGRVFERKWDGKHWSWVNHRRPKGGSPGCRFGFSCQMACWFSCQLFGSQGLVLLATEGWLVRYQHSNTPLPPLFFVPIKFFWVQNESILFTAEDHRLAERVFEAGKWEWR